MSEREKKVADTLARALDILPDGKKEFLLGYAEGVTAMAERKVEVEQKYYPHMMGVTRKDQKNERSKNL